MHGASSHASGVPGVMSSHHEQPPVEPVGMPTEEDVDTAAATEDLEREPDEKTNYTERHPEHFQDPPGHVRELRDDDTTTDT